MEQAYVPTTQLGELDRQDLELDTPVCQKSGTYQCWWLSLLEVARATDMLSSTFKEGGKLNLYYATGYRAIPAEGTLPEGVILVGKTDEEKLREKRLEVYGPKWQRMIMFFLLDKSNGFVWYRNNATFPTSGRKTELEKLLANLGVTGITFCKPLIPYSAGVSGMVNGLLDGVRVLVDKKSHAMSGIVVKPEKPEAGKKIKVFNHSTGITDMCWVQPAGKDDASLKLRSKLGDTVLNWILPLTITKPQVNPV
ncbi:hypothetical protein V502_00926 [Pseudogymnoascus sp. VKM F-4520 (FW-2644)]|nr:hypothetical protein V502_00926 [Pseudogymnoascus sp. VKM F-4520 (FW-2644)]